MTRDKYQNLPIFHFAPEIQKRHNKKNLKCLIVGNFGAKNLGDEAILAGEIAELRKIPNISITVAARYPLEVKRLHKVNAISMYALYDLRREIKKSDFIMIGGGGLINKVERNLIGFFYQLYMIFTYFMLPRGYRKKIYVTGIGVYDNANPMIVSLVRPFLRSATFLTVRDFHSYEFLKRKNVLAMLYKDNSYLMDLALISEVMQEGLFMEHYRKNRKNIGISLLKPDNAKDEKRLMNVMISYLGKYIDDTDFWFFPADVNPEYFNDKMFGEKLHRELKRAYGDRLSFHFVSNKLSPQVFFAAFKLMDSFVAMRFHAALFSYRNNIPFAGISYDKKCTSFIESVGRKSLSLKNLQVEELIRNVL